MFALVWREAQLDRLADLYLAARADERERMAAGVEALNARLRSDPLDVGESRETGYRVVFVPHLVVMFHVEETERIVRVVRLRPSRV